jgi:hypothetical protein
MAAAAARQRINSDGIIIVGDYIVKYNGAAPCVCVFRAPSLPERKDKRTGGGQRTEEAPREEPEGQRNEGRRGLKRTRKVQRTEGQRTRETKTKYKITVYKTTNISFK